MKKLVVSILTILSCGAAYALPVGNPTEASLFLNGLCWESCGCCDICDPCFNWCDAWSFRVGYYGDFVFDRHLHVDGHDDDDDDDDDDGGMLQETRLSTNAAYFALNFCDRVDVFATVGTTHIHFRTNENVFGGGGFESEFDFSTRFSWSVGGRATLWECGCFGLGVEGQYFSTRPRLNYVVDYPTGTKFYFDGERGHYREWQVGLGVSYRIATSCPTIALVPYAAVKWSRARFDLPDVTIVPNSQAFAFDLEDLRSRKHWGWALGVSFTLCDMAGVTVEGRWADEKALYVNGQIRF